MSIVWRTTRSLGEGRRNFEIRIVKPPAAEVALIDHTSNPVQTMAIIANTYNGILKSFVPDGENAIPVLMQDIQNTKLKTPLEVVHFTWLITNVTRAFTHQLVRYRIGASYAQESMRFYGQKSEYNVLATGLTTSDDNINLYGEQIAYLIHAYEILVDKGVPSQDARGLLPTNTLTSIFFDCSFLTLQNIFNQRVCCQAQHPEWLPILLQMRNLLETIFGKDLADMLTAPIERSEPCGYNASFDRPCTWKLGQQINEQEVLNRI